MTSAISRRTPTCEEFFTEQARWDEGHVAPINQILEQTRGDKTAAYKMMRDDLDAEDMRERWKRQQADDIAALGCDPDRAYDIWRDAYLRLSKDRLYRENPSDDLSPTELAAVEKYLEFHRYDAKHLDTADIQIPEFMYKGGKGLWVTYRSRKVDPSTLVRPRRPVDYIHEFDAGVNIYRADPGTGREKTRVPEEFRHVGALTKLAMCLGFSYKGPDGEVEGQSSRPMPELACSPDGKCLYIIQDRRRVLAMIWGGALGVFARGIDG